MLAAAAFNFKRMINKWKKIFFLFFQTLFSHFQTIFFSFSFYFFFKKEPNELFKA
jgi:hypothetical protein